MLQKRINSLPTVQARVLTEAEYAEHADRIIETFFPFSASDSTCRDITDDSPSDVRRLLTEWGLTAESEVRALWPYEDSGIVISGRQFVEHYDDLWYPSGDDVWIVLRDYTMLIYITHEEEACRVRPRQTKRRLDTSA